MGGGGKGGKGAPDSPDFMGIAKEQGAQSQDLLREQTFANRPDQYGPFGSVEWDYTPGAPIAADGGEGGGPGFASGGVLGKLFEEVNGSGGQTAPGTWAQRISLAEPLQTAADRLMGQLASGASLDPAQARDQAINSAYQMQTSRLDPAFTQRQAALETQLANEGFSRGDEGWGTAAAQLGRDRNDAYQQALLGAQSGAGNVAFGQSLAANMQPYQQLAQIRGLGQPSGFTPAGQANAADLLGAAMQQYGANLDQYNAGQAGKNSKMGAGSTLGAAYLLAPQAAAPAVAASDERLKTEIERLPVEAIPGVPFARWRWKDTGDVGFGCIAQDLEKVRPDLVVEIDGVKHVLYGGLR